MRNQQSKGQWAMDFFVRAPMSNKKNSYTEISLFTAFLLISSKQFLNESFFLDLFRMQFYNEASKRKISECSLFD